jgi:hypothetical protein
MRLVAPAVLLLALAVPRAYAQLASAELFVDIHAATHATDDTPKTDNQTYDHGPTTTDGLLGSGSFPWMLQSVVTDASAKSTGQVDWLAAATQLRLAANVHNEIESAAPSAASGGFDAVIKLTFTVSEQTPFTIAGGVSTGRALSDSEVVACQINGTVLAGDSRATPLPAGDYPIDHQGVISPGESFSLECAARSDGGTADASTVGFDATVTFGDGDGGPSSTTTTTLQPLTKKQCKKACRRAGAACRQSCKTLDKADRKTCKRQCNDRKRQCGQSTGCQLPL